jgi:hypothetical protein
MRVLSTSRTYLQVLNIFYKYTLLQLYLFLFLSKTAWCISRHSPRSGTWRAPDSATRRSPELAIRHDRGLDALQTAPLAGRSLNFIVNAIAIAEIEDKKR